MTIKIKYDIIMVLTILYCKSTRHTAKIDFDTISVALYTVVLKVTDYKYETHGTISATAYTEVHRSSCTTIISV